MKVKFLGISAGWPLPRLGCQCLIFQSKDPKDRKTRSQLLVNEKILLDAGPDTYHNLRTINPTKIEACFITHKHPDHVLGLWDLEKIYNLKRKISVIKPKERTENFKIDKISLTFLPVVHFKSVKTCAILIKEEDKTMVYAPDIREVPKLSEEFFKNSDLLIIGGSSLTQKGRAKGHETIEERIDLAKKMETKFVYFTHIGHATLKHKDLENFVQKKVARISM